MGYMTIDSHDKDADGTDHVHRLIDDAAIISAADLLEAVEVAIKIEASNPTPGAEGYVDDVLARAEAGDPIAVAIVKAARAPISPTPAAIETREPAKGSSTWLSWDWKSCPELDELRDSLAPLGVSVYLDPLLEGSDTYGFIFSRAWHSADELEKMSREHHGEGS